MRALGALLLGLLALGVLHAGFFYLFMQVGCWRWDPGSWRQPAHCQSLGGLLTIAEVIAFMGVVFVPIIILGRKKS